MLLALKLVSTILRHVWINVEIVWSGIILFELNIALLLQQKSLIHILDLIVSPRTQKSSEICIL